MLEVMTILMNRDGNTQDEAEERIIDCRDEILLALQENSGYEPEEIIMDHLGLEPDYLIEILGA
jgi:hypothetical protein